MKQAADFLKTAIADKALADQLREISVEEVVAFAQNRALK